MQKCGSGYSPSSSQSPHPAFVETNSSMPESKLYTKIGPCSLILNQALNASTKARLATLMLEAVLKTHTRNEPSQTCFEVRSQTLVFKLDLKTNSIAGPLTQSPQSEPKPISRVRTITLALISS